ALPRPRHRRTAPDEPAGRSIQLARPDARAAREGHARPLPDDPGGLLGKRRLLVGRRVLERLGGTRRVLPGPVRGDAEHLPEAAPALRPVDRRGERVTDGLGRDELEGVALPHLRHRPRRELQRPPGEGDPAVAYRLAHVRADRRRLDEARGNGAHPGLRDSGAADSRLAHALARRPGAGVLAPDEVHGAVERRRLARRRGRRGDRRRFDSRVRAAGRLHGRPHLDTRRRTDLRRHARPEQLRVRAAPRRLPQLDRPGGRDRIAMSRLAGLLAIWAGSAAILSALAAHVRDWSVMTDELLYERFAISVAQSGSPLPRLRGELVPSLSHLYPLLIAPFFRDGSVPHDIHAARIAGAWIMSSACIPAFLLARRVTGRTWLAYLAAALAIWMPWILYSSFLLTEVVAYPAFLWCVLALQRALSAPSTGNDALAILGLALAYFARTQLALLVVVLPVAALLVDGRAIIARHRLLSAAYAVLAVAAVVLIALGRFANLFGVYGNTVGSDVLPHGVGRWLLEHAALLALGLGVVPFVVGLAWLLASVIRVPLDRES